MSALRELLTEVAAEAGPYDVTDRAVRTVRRRRRLAVIAPVAAALLVAAGTVVALPLRPAGEGEAPAWSSVVSWLPTRLVPVGSPPPLPTGRPVAPAALAYTVRNELFPGTLLTEDGRHYRMPGDGVRAISPDGRWVVFRRGETLALRDLTGTAVRDLGVHHWGTVGAWSPDSRWLALRTYLDGDPTRRTTVVGLASGETFGPLPDPDMGTGLCGLRDTGDLLTCTADKKSTRFVVREIDPRTGEESRRVTVDPTAALTEAERQADWAAPLAVPGSRTLLRPDGRTLLMRTTDYLADRGLTRAGDILAIDLDHPEARPRRYDLPAGTLGKEQRVAGGSRFGGADLHLVVAVADEGMLVIHYVPRPGAPMDREVVAELDLLDPDSGRLSRAARVVGRVYEVIVRGQPQVD
jgi:hypothetical protein